MFAWKEMEPVLYKLHSIRRWLREQGGVNVVAAFHFDCRKCLYIAT